MVDTIFEDFIEYCKEDNKQLAKDIETWLADYFDLPNRTIPLEMNEEDWICKNLSEENQVRILGYKAKGYNLRFMKQYCNKCLRFVEDMNDNEIEELQNEGSFVCSDCINKEMEKEDETLCDRCNKKLYRKGDLCEDEIVEEDDMIIETLEGHTLCNECDCERLSCMNNPDNPKSEKEFLEEVIKNILGRGYNKNEN